MKHVEVVAAIIFEDGKVFCAQRKDIGEIAKKWEFPGGKIESGETREVALAREIREELNIDIEIGDLITTVNHQYNTFSITMHAYQAKIISGTIQLNDHIDLHWLSKNELYSLDWAAADIPIVEKVKELLK